MRLSILAVVVLAALAASPAAASTGVGQSPLTGREAALAVREEVGANWVLLETARRGPGTRPATVEVVCMSTTPRRRLCSWEASNETRGVSAEGLATVRALPGGASARLYAYRCEARGLTCV